MNNKFRRTSLRLLVSVVATLSAAGLLPTSAEAAPLPIAFVYLGNPGDAGWTFAHNQGAKAVEAKFGERVKVTRVENVPESADAERVIRDLALKGNRIIVGTSFGYQDFNLKVARDFPDVLFLQSGYKVAKNFGSFDVRMYQGAYLAGVMAGYVTKTNTLGFVGSIPIPEVIRNIDAYTLGARSVNPKIHTKVVWVNAWFDPGKEKQAAETLIGLGADVLLQNTDSTATLRTAEEKHVHAFGWDSDMHDFGPNAHLASVVANWGVYYNDVVQKVMDNTFKPSHVWWGVPQNAIQMQSFNPALPPAAQTAVVGKQQQLKSGWDVFTGPINDQFGAAKVPAGTTLGDVDLVKLNWYVEGVDGDLPK